MKILCTICARGGSIGVKNKNIRKLRGKPLIAHSILQAKNSNLFDSISVSSDSSKILTVAKKWGADYTIERPINMATATAPKLPVIQHAVLATEKIAQEKYDFIVDLDATAPLRNVEDIIVSFNMLLNHANASNLVTGCPARKSPYFNMLELDANGYASLVKKPNEQIFRRQDSSACYDMNASIYVWKRHILLNSNSVILDNTLLYVMPADRSVDIDTEMDWNFVKFLAKKRKDLE